MLNERLEVEAYLCDVKSNDNLRILPSILTGKYTVKLNGLQDILVLIAREFLFDFMKTEECTKEVHDACISAIRLWCAFDDFETLKNLREKPIIKQWLKRYSGADCWLKNYYNKIVKPNAEAKSKLSSKKKREANNNKTMWELYVDKWQKRLITPEENLYSGKRFCYENILAEAIADGPLKVRYLVFKGDENTFNKSLSKIGAKPSTPTFQKNHKFLATNLLAAEHSSNQETIYLRKIRFLNWLGCDNDNLPSWFPGLRWNDQDICQRFSGKDFVKLKMNKEFIEHYDIKLIDETNLKDYESSTYTILKDVGHGVPLEKLK